MNTKIIDILGNGNEFFTGEEILIRLYEAGYDVVPKSLTKHDLLMALQVVRSNYRSIGTRNYDLISDFIQAFINEFERKSNAN